VRFQPEVIFSYDKPAGADAPTGTSIGIGGAYDHGWKLNAALAGKVDTGRLPLRLPFAEVHLHTTITVAGLPVVVDADLTYFYQLSAAGRISIDAEQKTTGDMALGAVYRQGTGWTQLPVTNGSSRSGDGPTITGSGNGQATIGATLSIALYGSVGASLVFGPYLRAAVEAPLPAVHWGLYGGFTLQTTLFVHLEVMGVPVFNRNWDLPPLTAEWPVAEGSL
jgi:hypothetical protein